LVLKATTLGSTKIRIGEEKMSKARLICSLALPAAMLLASLHGASAQGESAREACTPDAMRLCNEFIPDEARVKSCMLSKRSQLSEACRLAMRGGGRVEGERGERADRGERGERHHHYYHHHHHHDD